MVKKVEFLKSISALEQAPHHGLPEVAVVGRSNAGKSSFINYWLGRKVAFVSQSPGRTRVLNFFAVNDKYCLVDMPGYGFAARDQEEMLSWAALIEDYLATRPNLKGVVLLMDVQRPWTDQEEQVKQFVTESHLPLLLVLTRADKLKSLELKKKLHEIQQVAQVPTFAISNTKKTGLEVVLKYLFTEWMKSQ